MESRRDGSKGSGSRPQARKTGQSWCAWAPFVWVFASPVVGIRGECVQAAGAY